jgi:hypothetical protein
MGSAIRLFRDNSSRKTDSAIPKDTMRLYTSGSTFTLWGNVARPSFPARSPHRLYDSAAEASWGAGTRGVQQAPVLKVVQIACCSDRSAKRTFDPGDQRIS